MFKPGVSYATDGKIPVISLRDHHEESAHVYFPFVYRKASVVFIYARDID